MTTAYGSMMDVLNQILAVLAVTMICSMLLLLVAAVRLVMDLTNKREDKARVLNGYSEELRRTGRPR